MAIAFEAYTTQTGDFVSSLTKALNAGTNDNRCVVVFAMTDRASATTINSATYGGVSMTAHTAFTSTPSSLDGRLFYLAGAASGSNNVVVTLSDGNTKPKFVAVAYSGVDGTTPLDQLTNYAASTSTPSSTITSESGDIVTFLGAYYGRTAVVPSSPATENIDEQIAATGFYVFEWEEAGAASVTIDGTVTGGAAEVLGTAFNINAAAGATGVPATNRLLMGVG